MSIVQITIMLAYAYALIGAIGSKTDMGKIKWILWAILILLAHIADKVTP
jgi:hypothetical protein